MSRKTGFVFLLTIIFLISLFAAYRPATAAPMDPPKGGGKDWIEYQNIKRGKLTCDVGVLGKDMPENQVELTVVVVAVGKGTDYRKWVTTDIKLDIDGNLFRSGELQKFYGQQKSLFRLPAAFVFGAIGSQYEMYGDSCESGQTCPVTGQPTVQQPERGPIARGIDKAGMAAGLSLLTLQAKGEITGVKAKFRIQDEVVKKAEGKKSIVKLVVENKEKKKKERFQFDIDKILAKMGAWEKLASARSYDPKTGITTVSQEQFDGSRTVTKMDKKGNVISSETVPPPEKRLPSASTRDPKTGIATTSQANPDGSHTITRTDKNGKLISKTTEPTPGKSLPSITAYDPATGITTTSQGNPDGSRTVTQTDQDGNMLSQEVRR